MAGIFFTIGGKYDPTGINNATKSVKGFFEKINNSTKPISGISKAIGTLSKAFKGLFVIQAGIKIAQTIKGIADATKESFLSQSKALTQLNLALKTNASLTSEAMSRITKSINSIPRVFDDDSINANTAYLSNLKLTEEQITETMKAASDLAASGIMPLEQAVKGLAQTYGGTSGTIGKMIPEIKQMTKEELEQGKAVQLVAERYKGLAEAMYDTFDGRNNSYENTIGNLKASIGSIFASVDFGLKGWFEPIAKDITQWFEEHKEKIITGLYVIGQVLKIVLSPLGIALKIIGQTIGNVFDIVFDGIVLVKDVVFGLFNAIYKSLDNLAGGKITAFLNTILRKINEFIEKHPKIAEFFGLEKINIKETKVESLGEIWSNYGRTLLEDSKALGKDLVKLVADPLKTTFNGIASNIKTELNLGLPQDVKNALSNGMNTVVKATGKVQEATEEATDAIEDNTNATEKNTDNKGNGNGILGSLGGLADALKCLGDFGAIIQAVMSSNWIGLIIQLLSAVANELNDVCENFSILSNAFANIAKVAVDFIDIENLNHLLQPFVDGLEGLGKILGVLLDLVFHLADAFTPLNDCLTEILNLIADLLVEISPLLNLLGTLLKPLFTVLAAVLRPVIEILKVFIKVIETIYTVIVYIVVGIANFFITIWNVIYKIFDFIKLPTGISIGWSGISIRWKSIADLAGFSKGSYLDPDDYKIKDSEYEREYEGKTSNNASGSASYTAARDIYVTINYNNSYINGDAQKIAINLWNEIKAAEKMNLIA